ncbi:MAG: LysR family transcriptional regulator [Alphaproteobacteria bacterium]|nr:LysR family transcriptional regulator [Alphaproteobacteria bacterium]
MQTTLERLTASHLDPRISRRNLSYFYFAATELNFTRAAKSAGVAQPSLSRGIVLLEAALNDQLFERIGKTVQLTPRGRALLPAVEYYLNQYLDFAEWLDAQKFGDSTRLRISAISTLTAELLPRIISDYQRANPATTVELNDGINDEIVRSVLVGSVDLGITTTVENPSQFRTKLLFKDRYAVAVNSAHRLFDREVVSWKELEGEQIATFERSSSLFHDVQQSFQTVGIHFEPKTKVKYRNTLMGLVRHQGMITILPKLAIQESLQPNVRAIPIIDPIVERSYYILTRKDHLDNSAIRRFHDYLQAQLGSRH